MMPDTKDVIWETTILREWTLNRRNYLNAAVVFLTVCLQTIAIAEDWPQWRGPRRDGTWEAENIVSQFDAAELKRSWSQPIGSGYSGPTVAKGRVYITDRILEPEEIERVHCFDFKTGEPLWSRQYVCPYGAVSYTAGPRASVSVDGDRAYSLGATGQLYCLSAETGDTLWHRNLDEEYDISRPDAKTRMPIWGIAASPLILNELLVLHIGGRDGACVVALDKMTGKEVWRALDDRAQYSAPILIEQAGKSVVVVWTGDSVAGLAPETGEVYWRHVMTPGKMPIGVATPIVRNNHLFVTSFYDGSLMLKLHEDKLAVTEVWRAVGRNERNTKALHSIISTPIWIDDHIYGVDSYGELRCLEAATGKRIWEDLTATPKARWSTIHFTRHNDDIWMFNERGALIIGKLSPKGFVERSRSQLIAPTMDQLRSRKGVCWSHPAFANGFVIARNDQELVCVSLREE